MKHSERVKRPFQHIYFAESSDGTMIKIGQSRDVLRRLYSLSSMSEPMKLLTTIPFANGLERRLHQFFETLRVKGEWFRNDESIHLFINGLPDTLKAVPVLTKKKPAKQIAVRLNGEAADVVETYRRYLCAKRPGWNVTISNVLRSLIMHGAKSLDLERISRTLK